MASFFVNECLSGHVLKQQVVICLNTESSSLASIICCCLSSETASNKMTLAMSAMISLSSSFLSVDTA